MADDQQNDSMGEMQQTDGGSANGGNSQESDDDRKLFVGGLSWETSENDLKEYFEKFGKVTSCNLKKDLETMRSRGFGFVVFETAEAVEKVLGQEEKHVLQNKTIDPKRANPKGRFTDPPIKKIYVAKVDPAVTEETIKEYFGQWGEVEKVEAPFDKEKEMRRNFVFVEFKNEDSVDKVLNHSTENPEFKHTLGSDEIEIKKATPGQRGRGRGGFFRGGDRGGRGGRGGYGGYGGWNDYSSGGYGGGGYGGYGQNYGGYGGYGQYPGYGGYDAYSGWGGYDQYAGYGGYGGYAGYGGGYDYSGWGGYGDQSGGDGTSGQAAGYGKAPYAKRGASSGYKPY